MIPNVSSGNPKEIALPFNSSRKSSAGSLRYRPSRCFDLSMCSWIRYIRPAMNATAKATVPSRESVTCIHTLRKIGSSTRISFGKAAAEMRETKAIGRMKEPRMCTRYRSSTTRKNRTRAQEKNDRSEEHTSELQSLAYLVCRLLLEKKKK